MKFEDASNITLRSLKIKDGVGTIPIRFNNGATTTFRFPADGTETVSLKNALPLLRLVVPSSISTGRLKKVVKGDIDLATTWFQWIYNTEDLPHIVRCDGNWLDWSGLHLDWDDAKSQAAFEKENRFLGNRMSPKSMERLHGTVIPYATDPDMAAIFGEASTPPAHSTRVPVNYERRPWFDDGIDYGVST